MAMLTFDCLARAVGERLECGAGVPVLVFRMPEFERLAWRTGRRSARNLERRTATAFALAAQRVVRRDDLLAHDDGCDRFAVALIAPSRSGRMPEARDVRAALERTAAETALLTGRRMETGWWRIERADELVAIGDTLDAALERGARERRHGQMLATIGHELRTPLTSIRGYIETLLAGDVDAATARRFLETARREALRLGRLVEGMLEFSMLDLSARAHGAVCDTAQCARAAIETALPLARQRRVALRASLSSPVPARVDADLCMHALVNLVENAAKYCDDGGNVEIGCFRDGDFAMIVVDDDGPGIARDDCEAIFDLGVRAAPSRGGSGIGLAVVKAVADRAGGDVRALASPLGGARFVLRFPGAAEAALKGLD